MLTSTTGLAVNWSQRIRESYLGKRARLIGPVPIAVIVRIDVDPSDASAMVDLVSDVGENKIKYN